MYELSCEGTKMDPNVIAGELTVDKILPHIH